MIAEGDRAPTFTLPGVQDGEIHEFSLTDQTDAGRSVLLSFYAFDFNPICTGGMCSLRDTDWFTFTDDLIVFGVSTDGVYAHRAFAAEHGITFPLLSDTDGSTADAYGVLADEIEGMPGVARRSVFLIDPDREVRFAAAVDADEPGDIDITPVEAAVRGLAD